MKIRYAVVLAMLFGVTGITLAQRGASDGPAPQALPLAQKVSHYDPAKNRNAPSVHAGAGPMFAIGSMLENDHTDTNLWFLHRGEHSRRRPASARISTTTARRCSSSSTAKRSSPSTVIPPVLKGPVGAPVRMGHSHAIYNHTDKPVEWMNINVTAIKGWYDAYDLGDSRAGAPVEPNPNFMVMRLDRTLLRPFTGVQGGKGTVQARRALDVQVFLASMGITSTTFSFQQDRRLVRARMRRSAGSITCWRARAPSPSVLKKRRSRLTTRCRSTSIRQDRSKRPAASRSSSWPSVSSRMRRDAFRSSGAIPFMPARGAGAPPARGRGTP